MFVDVVPSSTQRHQDWFWCLCELKTHNLNPAENGCENKIWNQRLKEKKQNYCHSITFFIVSYLYFLRIRSPCTCTSDWSSSTSFDLAPSGFFFCSVKTGRTFKGTRFQSLDQTKKQVVTWFQRHLLKKKEFADGNITAEELRIKKRCLKAVTCDCDQVAVVFISDPQSMFLVN